MEWLTWCMEHVPTWLNVLIGLSIWLLSCVVAINLSLGKDSLFMYKQLEYAVGPVPAVVLFHLGWFLWPIGLASLYIFMMFVTLDKEHWLLIWKRIRKVILWIMCFIIGYTGGFMLYTSIF